MPDGTNNPTKQPGGWSAARQHLATWSKPALLALVKDLYDDAAANRDFIQARCQADESGGEVLEKYRSKIVEQFFPKRGEGKLKLGEARKAIFLLQAVQPRRFLCRDVINQQRACIVRWHRLLHGHQWWRR